MNPKVFEEFHLHEAILRAISAEGYLQPTDIQCLAIPQVLAGKDVLATAQTGTGKTAAFALPILDILQRRTAGGLRALVLTPTRELAAQVEASLRTYGRYLALRSCVVVGGVSMNLQTASLRRRPDILVATPGRLLDLLRQKQVQLNKVEILVLDEADRMLDMGFIQDVKRIVAEIPRARQTLFFSATMSPEIIGLADGMLRNPVSVGTTPPASVAMNIDQKVLFVEQHDKGLLLIDILKSQGVRRSLVFARTKHRADRIMRHLSQNGVSVDAIHSNKSQNARQRTLSAFDTGRIKVLVATDILARGIDVEGISHVINYDLPNDPENYVHRVGRTARAGAAGIALSFCDGSEISMLTGIEKFIKGPLTQHAEHPFHSSTVASLHSFNSGTSGRPAQWRSFKPTNRRRTA